MASPKAERLAKLNAFKNKINKDTKSEVMVLGKDLKRKEIGRISTGSVSLDSMLGGGWPLNVWNEVIGMESAGKTTIVLKTLAYAMAEDPEFEAFWVAAEEFNFEWAEDLGVDLDRLHVMDSNIMEHVYDAMDTAFEERLFDAVVLDSLPALVPGKEAEDSMLDWQVGLGARLTNKFVRITGKGMRRSLVHEDRDCLAIIINQWREKIGVMHGDPRTTPGGKGKDYAYFTRVEVARDEWIRPGAKKDPVGQRIKCRTRKNKTAPWPRTGAINFYVTDYEDFRTGDYDSVGDVADLAVASGVFGGGGGGVYRFGEHKWKGQAAILESLRDDPALFQEVWDAALAASQESFRAPEVEDVESPPTPRGRRSRAS